MIDKAKDLANKAGDKVTGAIPGSLDDKALDAIKSGAGKAGGGAKNVAGKAADLADKASDAAHGAAKKVVKPLPGEHAEKVLDKAHDINPLNKKDD